MERGLLRILMLVLFASQASAAIINPGFETRTTAFNLEGWTFAGSGPFSGGADDEFVTQGLQNGRVFSHCGLGASCPTVNQGDFGSLSQSFDFTGLTALVLDVQLRQGGGTGGVSRWDNKFTGSILIDDTTVWSTSTSVTLNDLQIPLAGLTGLHTLKFVISARVLASVPSGSNHFNFDDLRAIGPVVPEPGTAALTGVGLLALGARRRARARRG